MTCLIQQVRICVLEKMHRSLSFTFLKISYFLFMTVWFHIFWSHLSVIFSGHLCRGYKRRSGFVSWTCTFLHCCWGRYLYLFLLLCSLIFVLFSNNLLYYIGDHLRYSSLISQVMCGNGRASSCWIQ